MIRFFLVMASFLSLGMYVSELTAPLVETEAAVAETTPVVVVEADFDTTILHVNFCGDTLPLHQATVAKRYQKAVQFYGHPGFARSRASTRRKLKQVEKILVKEGIPSDFKYMPFVESRLDGDAVSPRGATGYWQFMPATAEGLGLVVNEEVDERKDLVKSTRAAAKYLKWLYRELGDWALVAAAYNAGPNRIIRHMDRQNKDDYFALRLNNETARYVYRLVAAKEWVDQPERSSQWAKASTVTKVTSYMKRKRQAEDIARALTLASFK